MLSIFSYLGIFIVFYSFLNLIKNIFNYEKYSIEINFLFSAILIAYSYRMLRALSIDHFFWIIIYPLIILVYLSIQFLKTNKIKNIDLVDILFFLFFLNGVFSTIFSIILSTDYVIGVTKFVHFYFPVLLYFLCRIITSNNSKAHIQIINFVWIISTLLILDFVLEYYFISYLGNPSVIPWSITFLEQFASNYNLDIEQKISSDPKAFFQNLGIFGYIKVITMSIASLSFFYIASLFVFKKNNTNSQKIFYQNLFISLFLFVLAAVIIFLSRNTTSIILLLLISSFIFLSQFTLRGLIMFSIISLALFFLFKDIILIQYQIKFLVTDPFGVTALEKIFDFETLFDEYKNNFYYSIFGQYIFIDSFARGGTETELRLFAYPIYFGWIWTFLIISIFISLLKASFFIAKQEEHPTYKIIGYGLLGFFLFNALDFHYPSFDRHGPFEMLFVLAGLAVSIKRTLHKKLNDR